MAVRNGASSIHARSFFSIFLSRYSVAIIFCRWSFPINLDKKIPRNKISLPIFGWVKWGGYFFSQLERLKKYCSQFGAKQMSGRLGFQTRRARTLRQLRCGDLHYGDCGNCKTRFRNIALVWLECGCAENQPQQRGQRN
jgi:hypothetical protein